MSWVIATIVAALFQTVRTTLQKQVKTSLPNNAINWARYSFGLPFVIIYVIVLLHYNHSLPHTSTTFLLFCLGTAITQIIGTALLLTLFEHRNFAIGITYTKTEALQTALLGLFLFHETLSWPGFTAIIVGAIGIMLISSIEDKLSYKKLLNSLWSKTALIGIASGTAFSCSGLFIRQASLTLNSTYWINAGYTLLIVISLQVIILGVWIYYKNKHTFKTIIQNWKPCTTIGLTSALGSIGWFTAFALTNAAYVKTVGQIELLFSVMVTHHFFKESIKPIEIGGIILVITSVILLIYTT